MPHTFILTPSPTLPHQDAKVGDLLKQLASAQSSVKQLTVRASDCDKVQSSVDQLTVRASDCDKKVQLASSDAQKLHSQIAAQEAVIKAKDAVIKTDEQKIQTLTQQKKELEADRAATEAKATAEAKHVADWKAKAEAEANAAADWKARAEAEVKSKADVSDDSDANDASDEAEAAAIAHRNSRRSPSNRRVNRRWADLDARRNRRSYSPSTFHGRLFSRYQNYCRGSRTGRKVHICVVIDMLEHKLANSEISMKDVDRDLETMLSDLGN